MSCPGSVALCAQAPKPKTSEAAAKGTVAHTLAEELVTEKVDELTLLSRIGQIVKQDDHEIEITDEMVDWACEYRDVIEVDVQCLRTNGKAAPVHTGAERKVAATSIDAEVWGRLDYHVYQKGNVLIIYDFKTGRNTVEVDENEQLATYAIAVMDIPTIGWAFDKVILKIIQPSAAHADGTVREWETTPAKLREFVKKAKAAVIETRSPTARIVAGDWCRWCAAQAVCPAKYAAAQEAAQADFSAVPTGEKMDKKEIVAAKLPEVRLMPVAKLAQALAWADTTEAFFAAVRTALTERLEAGEQVPGWKLVDKRANRAWADEGAVIAKFSPLIGEEKLYEPRKLLSPAKLEKVVGKKRGVDELTFKPDNGKTIARDFDPREGTGTTAQNDFAPVEQPKAIEVDCPQCDILGDGCAKHNNAEGVLVGAGPAKKQIWPI